MRVNLRMQPIRRVPFALRICRPSVKTIQPLRSLANIVFTLATRYIAAGEATFYMFIEFALGPFWVWLFIYEKPSNTTLYGGLIIFTALLTKAIADSRKVI